MKNISLENCKNIITFMQEMPFDSFYKKIEETTRNILEQCFGSDITFPINIKEMANKLDIEICERILNPDIGFQLQKISGYIRRKNDMTQIYINSKDDNLTKRYMIAHELSHYILDSQKTDNTILKHCVEPFFPEEREELLTDIMTACFLFPKEPVLECMQIYVNSLKSNQAYPLNGQNWLNYLSRTAEISYYHTLSCYQYVRHYMYALKDSIIKKNSCYREFFGI